MQNLVEVLEAVGIFNSIIFLFCFKKQFSGSKILQILR